MLELRLRASAICSYAHIAATKGTWVALSKTMRALLSRSDGRISRNGLMHRGMRFCRKPVSLAVLDTMFRMIQGRAPARWEAAVCEPSRMPQRQARLNFRVDTHLQRRQRPSAMARLSKKPCSTVGSEKVSANMPEAMLAGRCGGRRLTPVSRTEIRRDTRNLPKAEENRLVDLTTRLRAHRPNSLMRSVTAQKDALRIMHLHEKILVTCMIENL
jgi:hypothetical protein